MSKVKIVVVNENTLGYVYPHKTNMIEVLRALVAKKSRFYKCYDPGNELTYLSDTDIIRLANKHDFDEYNVSFNNISSMTDWYEYDTSIN